MMINCEQIMKEKMIHDDVLFSCMSCASCDTGGRVLARTLAQRATRQSNPWEERNRLVVANGLHQYLGVRVGSRRTASRAQGGCVTEVRARLAPTLWAGSPVYPLPIQEAGGWEKKVRWRP